MPTFADVRQYSPVYEPQVRPYTERRRTAANAIMTAWRCGRKPGMRSLSSPLSQRRTTWTVGLVAIPAEAPANAGGQRSTGRSTAKAGRERGCPAELPNGHLGCSVLGAGDRDRTGMASLEGVGLHAPSSLVSAKPDGCRAFSVPQFQREGGSPRGSPPRGPSGPPAPVTQTRVRRRRCRPSLTPTQAVRTQSARLE